MILSALLFVWLLSCFFEASCESLHKCRREIKSGGRLVCHSSVKIKTLWHRRDNYQASPLWTKDAEAQKQLLPPSSPRNHVTMLPAATEISRKIHRETAEEHSQSESYNFQALSLEKRRKEKKSPEGLSWKDEGFPKRFTDSYSLMGRQ